MSLNILVTGAGGFLGSHLFRYLKEQGHRVVGIDNYSLGTFRHTDIVEMDLVKDKDKVAEFIEKIKFDVIYHLAAWAHEGLSQFCPIKITENNYNATLNVLVPAIRSGVKKFVFTSSMSVYGDGNPPFDEKDDRKPVDIYAVAKTASEEAIEILSEVHGFDYVIVRPHNIYGPEQNINDPYRNVVGIFMNRVRKGLSPIVYGDGEQTRSFSYIDDVTPYLAKCGTDNDIRNTIYNIGPAEEFSINDLADEVLRAFNSDLGVEYLPDRPCEVKHAYCTNDKAIEELGYKTSTYFVDGIIKMTKWVKTQPVSDFKYLDELELINEETPETWSKRKM